jgi:hypothetical protein
MVAQAQVERAWKKIKLSFLANISRVHVCIVLHYTSGCHEAAVCQHFQIHSAILGMRASVSCLACRDTTASHPTCMPAFFCAVAHSDIVGDSYSYRESSLTHHGRQGLALARWMHYIASKPPYCLFWSAHRRTCLSNSMYSACLIKCGVRFQILWVVRTHRDEVLDQIHS